jgi:hypothetical protein
LLQNQRIVRRPEISCVLVGHARTSLTSMASALPQVRDGRRRTRETRARQRKHADYDKSGHHLTVSVCTACLDEARTSSLVDSCQRFVGWGRGRS